MFPPWSGSVLYVPTNGLALLNYQQAGAIYLHDFQSRHGTDIIGLVGYTEDGLHGMIGAFHSMINWLAVRDFFLTFRQLNSSRFRLVIATASTNDNIIILATHLRRYVEELMINIEVSLIITQLDTLGSLGVDLTTNQLITIPWPDALTDGQMLIPAPLFHRMDDGFNTLTIRDIE